MLELSQEGSVKFYTYLDKKISRSLPVFYNPVMKLNRDISLEVIKIFKPDSACLPLEGTGIRALRILKETKCKQVVVNDISASAFKLIKKNLKLNKLKAEVKNKDANLLLQESEGFDYIDIDPFGSPAPFLDSAAKSLKRNSILALTATDTAALCGTSPAACLRKYGSKPLLNEFAHETAARILITKAQKVAAVHEKALTPILSYSMQHYLRVFLISEKNVKKTDSILEQHKYLEYCPYCLYRNINDLPLEKSCPVCSKTMQYAGPLFIGKIQDHSLLKKIKNIPLIDTIKQELDVPFYYDTHKLSKVYKTNNLKKMDDIIREIKNKKYKASRTHFNPHSIKTDMPLKLLRNLF